MKKFAIVFSIFGLGLLTAPAIAQKKAPVKAKPAAAKAPAKGKGELMANGFTKLPSGLQYKVIKHGLGKQHPRLGDHLEMHIHVHIGDSTLFDSRKMNQNKPVPFQVQQPNFKGDPIEGFMLLVAGDSAQMRLPVDSIKAQGKPMMPGMKDGDVLEYEVVLISVKSDSIFKQEAEINTFLQKEKDNDALQGYFKQNNIKAMKTASGLYYTIAQEGKGEKAAAGNTVSVNYTGRLLGGKTFDSNTDPEFHHTEPFKVELGRGRVIKGWDEGLALLKKGTKATLYIPSGLAYGAQDKSPQIPANSILVFDVEILDIQTEASIKAAAEAAAMKQPLIDDSLLQDYFKRNHISGVEKTASGMYYKVTKQGIGEKPAPGDKVSVNYTGMNMEGKKFDSNIDTAFHHVQAFTFPLGKGQVIKGWDEGIGLLTKGSKATLYIPSGMAYGQRSPSPLIPANGVLIFDVELADIQK